MGRLLKVVVLMSFVLLLFLTAERALRIFYPTEKIKEREVVRIIRERQLAYEREEVNHRIRELDAAGMFLEVIQHYSEIASDKQIGMLILNNAMLHDVPVNLAFALVRQESNFNIDAKNENKKANGTVWSSDHGLMQLNTVRFKSFYNKNGLEWIMRPQNNVFLGIRALRELYDEHGSWDLAIIKYNGRFEKGADMHLVNVYQYEREYDRAFNERF